MNAFKDSSSIGNGFYFGSVTRCSETGKWLAFIHDEMGDRFGVSKKRIGVFESKKRAQRLVLDLIRSWSSGSSLKQIQENLWWSADLQKRLGFDD